MKIMPSPTPAFSSPVQPVAHYPAWLRETLVCGDARASGALTIMLTPSRFRPLPLLAALGLLPALAAAQASTEPAATLSDIVVTASRMPQAREDVLGDVTVIDSEALRQAGSLSLAEVLAKQPGVSFHNHGGPQSLAGINLRGADTRHTLVLLDGVPLNTATDGMPILQALPLASIERIEILRGAASSLYGSNAIGGVINLITRPDTEVPLAARASLGYGSRGTAKASAAVSGQQDAWTYHFGGGYERSRGFDATTPNNAAHNPDRDNHHNYSVNGGVGYAWAAGQSLDLQFFKSHVKGRSDETEYAVPLVDDYFLSHQDTLSLSSRNQINAVWHSTLRYAYSRTNSTARSWGGENQFTNYQNQFAWENTLQLAQNQSLFLAYEHLDQRVTEPYGYAHTRRHNNAVTGVYNGKFDRHHVQASVRNDNNSQHGNHATWGLGYGYDLTQAWRARVAANTGYQVPTLMHLYAPFGANPDLRPEQSRNLEAALEFNTQSLSFSATAYQNKVRDLIASRNFVPQNVERATLRGLTLAGHYHFNPRSSVWGSLDLLHARNDTSGNRLDRRAPYTIRLGAEHRTGKWRLGTDYTHVAWRHDQDFSTFPAAAVRVGSYGLWNLSAVYALKPNLDLALRWNNVLDKRYTTAYGFNMPRSHAFVELSWRL